MSSGLKIVKNGIKLKKLRPFEIEGSIIIKKPPNATKADSQTPTKFFICYFVVVKVPR
jgi:hypothetical protein